MLQDILSIKGVEKLSKTLQKSIKNEKVICKENKMCAQYGKHCEELACKEIPHFEINFL
ncbi:MAG TPA: hypothetical protein VLB74_08590 [Flavobacterium sp.]|uniref:hypothetical protein n=1 Tax=Flavobacterium sp. TaxID=239 RepID=UPI002C9939D7|nr:hypothetical protein [Flavobacterium sp.]HSD14691.1 hypothetical protein [Flavobacterium sp.]